MKKLYFFLIISILFFSKSLSQEYRHHKNSMKVNMIVDSSCGKCQFGDKTIKECMLSVKINSEYYYICLLYTSPSPRDRTRSRMPSSA